MSDMESTEGAAAPSASSAGAQLIQPNGAASAVDNLLGRISAFVFRPNVTGWVALAMAVLVLFPALGGYGLWDPWETHYGEVAREMREGYYKERAIQEEWRQELAALDQDKASLPAGEYERRKESINYRYENELLQTPDMWHPMWSKTWFYSKPVGLLWMMAAGWEFFGSDTRNPGLDPSLEWGARFFTALETLLCVMILYVAIARIFSRRAGFFAVLILLTSPQFFFLARQAVTDMPMAAAVSAALGCFMIAVFTKDRLPWGWTLLFWVWCAWGVLTKGLPGIVIPVVVIGFYLLIAWDWQLLRRQDFWITTAVGAPLFMLIALPWYVVMFLQKSKPDCTTTELLKYQFKFLATLEDMRKVPLLGKPLFNWLQSLEMNKVRACAQVDFENKTFFERFIIHDHFNRFAEGVHGERGNFAYYFEHMGFGTFPWAALTPLAVAQQARKAWSRLTRTDKAVIFVFVWYAVTFLMFTLNKTKFNHYIFPTVIPGAILIALFLDDFLKAGRKTKGLGLLGLFVLVAIAVMAKDLINEPKALPNLFVYKYDRPYPSREVNNVIPMNIIFWGCSLLLVASLWGSGTGAIARASGFTGWVARIWHRLNPIPDTRRGFVAMYCVFAVVFGTFVTHYLFYQLSPHWSQKYYFETYFHERGQFAGEAPMGAFLMNWRGETFYSKDTEAQLKTPSVPGFLTGGYCSARPNRKPEEGPDPRATAWRYFIVEQDRLNALKEAMPNDWKDLLEVIDKSNNKFYLARAGKPQCHQQQECADAREAGGKCMLCDPSMACAFGCCHAYCSGDKQCNPGYLCDAATRSCKPGPNAPARSAADTISAPRDGGNAVAATPSLQVIPPSEQNTGAPN
ncbi:MAG: Undecaprenyl phosphate-alpha-4-amino-4-deoxy-L-arabinose arabinosyl transferase [Myxococcota bacterium]|nr:Undecaprenyl phosphate-alpha-4-amino-4-deoxy-L-arabinose arabinosyl transferase [Myxococcota bacterium]